MTSSESLYSVGITLVILPRVYMGVTLLIPFLYLWITLLIPYRVSYGITLLIPYDPVWVTLVILRLNPDRRCVPGTQQPLTSSASRYSTPPATSPAAALWV